MTFLSGLKCFSSFRSQNGIRCYEFRIHEVRFNRKIHHEEQTREIKIDRKRKRQIKKERDRKGKEIDKEMKIQIKNKINKERRQINEQINKEMKI